MEFVLGFSKCKFVISFFFSFYLFIYLFCLKVLLESQKLFLLKEILAFGYSQQTCVDLKNNFIGVFLYTLKDFSRLFFGTNFYKF